MKEADIILRNAFLLTMDEEFRQFCPGTIIIKGDQIIALGPDADLKGQFKAPQNIDCAGKVLMPGLINGHTHAPMTLLRGLADDLRLDVWLMGYMLPVEREFVSPEFVRLGTQVACLEMIRSGITTFCDMYYFENDVAQTASEIGIRAICGETILKYPSPDSASYEDALEYTRSFILQWKDHPLIIPAIAPHSAYTCTGELLRACAEMAVELDVPLITHISETAQEVENMRLQTGMPVVPYVKKNDLFTARVIAAHCVHIDEGEIRTLEHHKAGVVHNPSSNLKLASGIAPIQRMIELKVNVGIGTDGPASNNDLDMFEEMRLASFIGKINTGDPTALPARTTLQMATSLGAKALHIGDITGSLEIGKKADLILVDISPIHNSPQFLRDPNGIYSQLVYASKATDVTDLMVNGRFLMRDREIPAIKEDDLLKASQALARRIDAFLIEREQSVISKLIAIGGVSEEESFEVQVKVRVKDLETILAALDNPAIEIIRKRHYREFDTYFSFSDPGQGHLRYREDHFVGPDDQVTHVRSRLTHIGPVREQEFPQQVVLSRSRYFAPATQSLRFYREYFQPVTEKEIEKDRLRFLVRFNDTEFFINLDTIDQPPLGSFLEIKSRTWSLKDAKQKSKCIYELLKTLDAPVDNAISQDYFEIAS